MQLSQGETLDFDLSRATPSATVHLSGAVSLNGTPLPYSTGDRGELVFRGIVHRKVLIGASGTYAVDLPEGSYQFGYLQANAICGTSIPCGDQALGDMQLTRGVQTLDVDLKGVHLTGTVTVDQQVLADAADPRGNIALQKEDGGLVYGPSLGATGPGTYDAFFAPGTYSVAFLPDPYLCSRATGPTQLPCNGAVLTTARDFSSDATLALDLSPVQVSASVTVNGAPLQELQGSIDVIGPVDTAEFPLTGTDGGGGFAATLFPGSYAFAFEPLPLSCETASTIQVPCSSEPLGTAALNSNQALNLDVQAVTVTGAVTVAGQPMGSSTFDRGWIQFARGEPEPPVLPSLGTSGPASYSVRLAPGTYDVSYSKGSNCDPSGPLPCANAALMAQVPISGNTTLDIDLPVAQVNGELTQNGTAITSGAGSQLVFIPLDGGASDRTGADWTASGSFSAKLWLGTYEIDLLPNACMDVPGALPCEAGVINAASVIAPPGRLLLDVPVAHLGGSVTVNGQPLPANPNLGAVKLLAAGSVAYSSGALSVPLSNGTSNYGVPLFPGAFDLYYSPAGAPQDGAMPAVGVLIKPDVQLTGAQTVDLALQTFQLSGTLTAGDGGLGEGDRGALTFWSTLADGGFIDYESFSLPTTGPATYAVTLAPGNYAITYEPGDCTLLGLTSCSELTLLGCVDQAQ